LTWAGNGAGAGAGVSFSSIWQAFSVCEINEVFCTINGFIWGLQIAEVMYVNF